MILRHGSVLRFPAVQALVIQGVSFVSVLIFLYCAGRLVDFYPNLLVAGLFQGTLAALISRWKGLPLWWLLIQFFFPCALIVTRSFDLPPSLFLAGFCFLLALYWTTFRTQVPFFPSSPATWQAVANLLPHGRSLRFLDAGSGLGGLVINLALGRPESEFVGIEAAPLPWLISVLRARIVCRRAKFIRSDYEDLDFARYDIVFAYLSPAAMPGLWEKAKREMRPGALLLSYEFPIPNVKSYITTMPLPGGPALFGWYM